MGNTNIRLARDNIRLIRDIVWKRPYLLEPEIWNLEALLCDISVKSRFFKSLFLLWPKQSSQKPIITFISISLLSISSMISPSQAVLCVVWKSFLKSVIVLWFWTCSMKLQFSLIAISGFKKDWNVPSNKDKY